MHYTPEHCNLSMVGSLYFGGKSHVRRHCSACRIPKREGREEERTAEHTNEDKGERKKEKRERTMSKRLSRRL